MLHFLYVSLQLACLTSLLYIFIVPFSIILYDILQHQLIQSIPQAVQVIFYLTRHKLQRKQKDSGTLGGNGGLSPQCKYTKDSICVLQS